MRPGLEDYVRRHPRVLRLASGALVIWAGFSLVKAIELHIQAARLVGELQRQASESLGG